MSVELDEKIRLAGLTPAQEKFLREQIEWAEKGETNPALSWKAPRPQVAPLLPEPAPPRTAAPKPPAPEPQRVAPPVKKKAVRNGTASAPAQGRLF